MEMDEPYSLRLPRSSRLDDSASTSQVNKYDLLETFPFLINVGEIQDVINSQKKLQVGSIMPSASAISMPQDLVDLGASHPSPTSDSTVVTKKTGRAEESSALPETVQLKLVCPEGSGQATSLPQCYYTLA